MQLTSPAFGHGEKIPKKYTCDGEELSPPLEIKGVPEKAKSLVLIMDDPDVPKFVREDQMWVHWVLFNIPPDTRYIEEDAIPPGVLGSGTGRMGYQGPCPPDREHRYFFKLYALDTLLKLKEGSTKEQVEMAMKSHILATSEWMGRYIKDHKH
jgi:Raf kinase inhibitor-like YbhB/YbcL family protein